eukprot:SAG31_NODE_2230_length_6144_cov_3.629115_3_plen_58_part_00
MVSFRPRVRNSNNCSLFLDLEPLSLSQVWKIVSDFKQDSEDTRMKTFSVTPHACKEL